MFFDMDRMNKILVLFVMVLCMFASSALAAGRPDQVLSVGAGYFGGMLGGSSDLMLHVPGSLLGTNDLYIRAGLAGTDSYVVAPAKVWHTFLSLYVDAVYYFYEDKYIGAGFNYPIRVSDNETGDTGSEIYFGMDMNMGIIGKTYIEAGWGSLRLTDGDQYEGLQCMIGWRYDLAPASAVQ